MRSPSAHTDCLHGGGEGLELGGGDGVLEMGQCGWNGGRAVELERWETAGGGMVGAACFRVGKSIRIDRNLPNNMLIKPHSCRPQLP